MESWVQEFPLGVMINDGDGDHDDDDDDGDFRSGGSGSPRALFFVLQMFAMNLTFEDLFLGPSSKFQF